ncbi:MAG: NADH-ubiquinone oxidoreductase-F iron-sulfur binding region domain-containing protein [Pseudomonadota bacterium]
MQLPFKSESAFNDYVTRLDSNTVKTEHNIYLCAGTGCRAAGAMEVAEALEREIKARKLEKAVTLKTTGCHGFCEKGPLCVQTPSGVFYQMLKPGDIKELVDATIDSGRVVDRLLFTDPMTQKAVVREEDIPFYANQERIVFGLNGRINPFEINDYILSGGYRSLAKALGMKPEDVLEEVKRANLRGRGGGGFPAGRKWESCRNAPGTPKYVICNADEGDPGAFMDRSIMEGNPHRVIEGMVIGSLAIGATEGYVYIRHEYPLALKTLLKALQEAERFGFLGDNILGSGHSLRIRVMRGGGAFVCGESTALMASLEGQVGEPRAKFIHTVEAGVWDKPSNLNNVETWANVPLIIGNGSDWFNAIGTEGSKGTKIFSLVGKVNNTGLVEVPMGITLGDLVFKIGGGILKGRKPKAVQTGGPSGGAIPAERFDAPVDFDALTDMGSMMGSGGMIVMDEETCMVDVARYFTHFLVDESCGKCTTCREGLRQMDGILTRICEGRGKMEDLDLLRELGEVVTDGSLCALGGTAANPLLSTLNYFHEEYDEHINQQVCRALVCKELLTYTIDEDRCTACGICRKQCPSEAISGAKDVMHAIDREKCIHCNVCFDVCTYGSVVVSSGKYKRWCDHTKTNLKPVKERKA